MAVDKHLCNGRLVRLRNGAEADQSANLRSKCEPVCCSFEKHRKRSALVNSDREGPGFGLPHDLAEKSVGMGALQASARRERDFFHAASGHRERTIRISVRRVPPKPMNRTPHPSHDQTSVLDFPGLEGIFSVRLQAFRQRDKEPIRRLRFCRSREEPNDSKKSWHRRRRMFTSIEEARKHCVFRPAFACHPGSEPCVPVRGGDPSHHAQLRRSEEGFSKRQRKAASALPRKTYRVKLLLI